MFMSSPSVITQTIDQTHYLPNFTNEVGCFVGFFERGPVDSPVFITNINEFKFIFGRGVDLHHNDWYQVYNYLQYASGIWVCRTSGVQKANATNEESLLFNNKNEFDELYESLDTQNIKIMAQTPGTWGNLLSVGIISHDDWENNTEIINGVFPKDIFTFFESDYVGLCVFRNNKIVESYYKTIDSLIDINDESKYIYVNYNDALNINNIFSNGVISLTSGTSAFPTDIDIQNSYDLFESPDYYDIDIIIGNDKNNNAAVKLAETRRDCIAFIGIPTVFVEYLKLLMGPNNLPESIYSNSGLVLAVQETIITKRMNDKLLNKYNEYVTSITESQFVHFTMHVKEQFDGFSGKNKLVNFAGDIAGLKSEASLRQPWSVGAGVERGRIKNINNVYFNMKDTDSYYKKGLNYIQNNVMATQKTFSTKKSAFSRIGTRSLFNHLEKEVQKLLRYYVFEDNTYRVREIIASTVRKYLEDIKSDNGIDAGRIHVHGENNEIIVDIYVKPKYVTEYIQLRMRNVGAETITNLLSNTLA
jgi:hypothetical protein